MPSNANTVANQTFQGVSLAWGLGGTDYTIASVAALFQSADTDIKYDELEIRNQRGSVVTWVGYNPSDSATLEYVITGSGSGSGSATISHPTQGAKISIGAATDDPISGSNWIVQGVTVRRTNTDAAKVSLKVIRYQLIT